MKPTTAAEVLESVDPGKVIRGIFQKSSLTLKQRTLADLWDRAYGRPSQNVDLSGGVVHAHWTPGMYDHLTDEEMALLDKLTKKLIPPQNQGANSRIKASHQ